MIKCPFRTVTTEYKIENGQKQTIQEFEECYGEECAAARIVRHLEGEGKWKSEVVGCCRIKD